MEYHPQAAARHESAKGLCSDYSRTKVLYHVIVTSLVSLRLSLLIFKMEVAVRPVMFVVTVTEEQTCFKSVRWGDCFPPAPQQLRLLPEWS